VIEVLLQTPDSYLLICPQCFDCWARLKGTDYSHWWHRYVPCEAHTLGGVAYGAKLGGSLLEAGDLSIDALNPFMIKRELSLYLKELA
jgi:hypothetical protein